MAISWITALKLIPWRDVVENAPTVLRTAKRLWDKQGDATPPRQSSLQQEVAALRDEARRAAEVIESLAEQNARLVQAVEVLRARSRLLMYAVGALSIVLLGLLVYVLAR